jgi:hypothetical protein
VRRSVWCTASFSVCALRRAKFPIIYPDLRLDYKVATHPLSPTLTEALIEIEGTIKAIHRNERAPDVCGEAPMLR